MEQLKVVIIAMHIYPKKGPRAYRATELALELSRQGHNVTLYALLGNFDYKEFSKTNKINIKSIGQTVTGLDHSDGTLRNNFFDKLLHHLLGRMIDYPLIELAFKIPAIIEKECNIDLLITIAFPHSIHWGAALAKKISKKFPLKWVSDCGDPYMSDAMNRGKYFYFKYIERFWCKKTDYITVPMVGAISGYYPEFQSKIRIIPQGFDLTKTKISKDPVSNPVPTFSYAGNIYTNSRDPTIFLNYISTLEMNFKFIVYTDSNTYFLRYSKVLGKKICIIPAIERSDLIFELSKVDFLINFGNNTNIQSPSKLIDYALTGRPIISISAFFPAHEMVIFNEFLNGNYAQRDNDIKIEDYDIINVTNKFIDLYYEN